MNNNFYLFSGWDSPLMPDQNSFFKYFHASSHFCICNPLSEGMAWKQITFVWWCLFLFFLHIPLFFLQGKGKRKDEYENERYKIYHRCEIELNLSEIVCIKHHRFIMRILWVIRRTMDLKILRRTFIDQEIQDRFLICKIREKDKFIS